MKNRFLKRPLWLWLTAVLLIGAIGGAVGSGWLDRLFLERALGTLNIESFPAEVLEKLTGLFDELETQVRHLVQQIPAVPLLPVQELGSSVLGVAFMFGLSVPVLLLLLLLWKLYHDPRYPTLALLISIVAIEFLVKDMGASVQTATMSLVFTLAVTLVLYTHYPLLFSLRRMVPLLRKSWRYREAVQRLHPNASARWHRPFCSVVVGDLVAIGLLLGAGALLPEPGVIGQVGILAGLYSPALLVLPLGVVLMRSFRLGQPMVFLGVVTLIASVGLLAVGMASSVSAAALRYPFWGGLLAAVLGQVVVDVYHDVQTAEKARNRINSLHRTIHHRAVDLKDMMVRAQAANLAKTQFVSSVSHELRTPLTAISGYAQILLEEQAGQNPMHEEFLGIIRQSCDRLKSLINDLLDMAKVESGRVELDISSIDLPPVLKEVTAQLLPLAENKKLQLLRPRIDVDAPVIHADPLRLRQVLINLLSNAIKFTDKGCVGIYVKESVILRYQGTQHSEPAIAIEVFDTGVGISKAFISQLFEPFTQEESAYSNTQQGTGLGLSITKELVERMGGTVTVESVVGEGTKFTVLLAQSAAAPVASKPTLPNRSETRLPEPPRDKTAAQDAVSTAKTV